MEKRAKNRLVVFLLLLAISNLCSVSLQKQWWLELHQIPEYKSGSTRNTALGVPSEDVHRPIYLDIHIAKTAGSERNAILSGQFERVCGHKGYSYDAYQTTRRFKEAFEKLNRSQQIEVQDIYWNHYAPYSRHRVPHFVMDEIGYENCDFISNELHWKFWRDKLPLALFAQREIPVEIHIPCRDPIDHLMSQCNFRQQVFNCTAESLEKEVVACVLGQDRFSFQLLKHFQSLENSVGLNSTFHCFDAMAVDGYIHYMSNRLQPKRLSPEYTHRPSNAERNRDLECIWNMDDAFQHKISSLLLEKYEYYQFCDSCMKSTNKLDTASIEQTTSVQNLT